MEIAAEDVFHVSGQGDVTLAKRRAKVMAQKIGFNDADSEECAIVAAELASNIVKHAHYGTISLTRLTGNDQLGLKIEAKDRGPGILNIESSFSDGYSTVATMGAGLGAVNRLMNEVEIITDNERGTHIAAVKWVKGKQKRPSTNCPFDIGAATQAYENMSHNGDSFVIKHWQNKSLVAIIDGVGHGQKAHMAAAAARHYLELHYSQPLKEMFIGASRACRSTRGVVMAVILLDWVSGQLTFASIGNIETRTRGDLHGGRFLLRRGIIGHEQMPNPVVVTEQWRPGSIFVMQTDGVLSRWKWEEVERYVNLTASQFSLKLLKKWAKQNDDATVIVIKDKA